MKTSRDLASPEVLTKLANDAWRDGRLVAEEYLVLADALEEYGYRRLSKELSKMVREAEKHISAHWERVPLDLSLASNNWWAKEKARLRWKKLEKARLKLIQEIRDAIDEIKHASRKIMWWVDDGTFLIRGVSMPRRRRLGGGGMIISFPVEVIGSDKGIAIGGRTQKLIRVQGLAGRIRGKIFSVKPDSLTPSPRSGIMLAPGTSHFRHR